LRESGRWPRIPIGINIGKSKLTPLEQAADDYRFSFQQLREFADYVVINVSSPNTPGLRDLQDAEQLGALLDVLQNENTSAKPLLVKIAPDLSIEQLEQIVATCEATRIAGLIATNTTVDHSAIADGEEGGLSGAPLLEKSNDIIRAIRARSRLPIIGVGGIIDAKSAQSKIDAGAQLVQIYTGLIYRGPALISEVAL
jgi:dihydroorotate dehydrogenase